MSQFGNISGDRRWWKRSPKGISGSWVPRASLAQGHFPGRSFCCPFSAPCSHFSEGHPEASWCLKDLPGWRDIFASGLPCLTDHKMESPGSHLYHFFVIGSIWKPHSFCFPKVQMATATHISVKDPHCLIIVFPLLCHASIKRQLIICIIISAHALHFLLLTVKQRCQ